MFVLLVQSQSLLPMTTWTNQDESARSETPHGGDVNNVVFYNSGGANPVPTYFFSHRGEMEWASLVREKKKCPLQYLSATRPKNKTKKRYRT